MSERRTPIQMTSPLTSLRPPASECVSPAVCDSRRIRGGGRLTEWRSEGQSDEIRRERGPVSPQIETYQSPGVACWSRL